MRGYKYCLSIHFILDTSKESRHNAALYHVAIPTFITFTTRRSRAAGLQRMTNAANMM